MNILITGGCGFIGSNLAEHMLNQGHNVFVVDNLSSGSIDNIKHLQHKPKFKYAFADITKWPELKDALKWADSVFHLAAIVGVQRVLEEPLLTLETNIKTTEIILNALVELHHHAKVFIASSSMVYGISNQDLLTETDILHMRSNMQGHWIYAISKLVGESLAAGTYIKHKLPITVLRIFNTIGPRQTGRYGMVVPRFVQQACTGKDITVFGDGKQSRSFCDIRDLVTEFELLLNTECKGEIINVGNDHEISINDLATLVKTRAKSTSTITHTSYTEAYGYEFDDILQRRPNLSKLKDIINFKSQWTLEDTIDNLIMLHTKDKV